MSTLRGSRRRLLRRVAWTTAAVLVGVGLAVASFLLLPYDQWWSALLANAAVVFVLLIPGEWLLMRFASEIERVESNVERVEQKAESATVAAESARQSAESTARSLEEIRESIVNRQRSELEAELDIYRRMLADPSQTNIVTALRTARDAELITTAGVRSPVWWTRLHYRYVLGEDNGLTVRLEEDDGTVLDAIAWTKGVAPEEFFQSLVMAVRASGEDLGTGLNDPTESVQTLSEMLVRVARLRSQEPLGHRNTLRRIIEFRNEWYFTERHVIPAEQLSYTIEVSRLNEMDWEEHLWRRFDGSEDALSFARTLYGFPRPENGFPADSRRNSGT